MYIPPTDIYQLMLVESAGIWFVQSVGNASPVVLLKAPTNILKAIIKGCKIKLVFASYSSKNYRILVSCLQINDDDMHPFVVANPHIQDKEQNALSNALQKEKVSLFLFDELNRNVAQSQVKFLPNPNQLLKMIHAHNYYVGNINSEVSDALDFLQSIIDPVMKSPNLLADVPIESLLIDYDKFEINNIFSYNINDGIQSFSLSDSNEGSGLEQSIEQLLNNLFKEKIYRSPQIYHKNRRREFVDVFALTDKGVFLFESKAIGLLSTSLNRSSDRTARNIENQIRKAIGQLSGAIRSYRLGVQIYSQAGTPIQYDPSIVPHAIILISEMYPFIDWSSISLKIMEENIKSSVMFHLFDLHELLTLVGNSESADHFDYMLMKRFENFSKTGNLYFRIKVQPNKKITN